jgi:hypothetical protein
MKQYIPYVLSSIVVPLIGLLIYLMRARIDIFSRKQMDGLSVQKTPYDVMKADLEQKAQDLRQTQAQHERFMQGLIKQQAAGKAGFLEVLDGLRRSSDANVKSLTDLHVIVTKHQEESERGRGGLHQRLNDIESLVRDSVKDIEIGIAGVRH